MKTSYCCREKNWCLDCYCDAIYGVWIVVLDNFIAHCTTCRHLGILMRIAQLVPSLLMLVFLPASLLILGFQGSRCILEMSIKALPPLRHYFLTTFVDISHCHYWSWCLREIDAFLENISAFLNGVIQCIWKFIVILQLVAFCCI